MLGLKLIRIFKSDVLWTTNRLPCTVNINATDAWWRHQMETVSALLAICAGNSPVPGEFPAQRPVTRGFDVFFDLRPNKRLSKQSRGWWFETLSCPLWRHCNALEISRSQHQKLCEWKVNSFTRNTTFFWMFVVSPNTLSCKMPKKRP